MPKNLRHHTLPIGQPPPKKTRRIKTRSEHLFDGPFPTTLDGLRRQVYTEVIQRLRLDQVIVSSVSPEMLSFLLPKNDGRYSELTCQLKARRHG
jgi:hypothetical protein